MATPPSLLDHLVFAAPDLERATGELEELLGVCPSPGGSHPGRGTRNALLALGEECYLEVIAPDPAQLPPIGGRPFGIDRLGRARLVTWAIKAPELEAIVQRLRKAGYDPGEVRSMSRTTPTGARLEWRLAVPPSLIEGLEGGVLPFLIDWGGTRSPARSAAAGCRLLELELRHPEPERLTPLLRAMGLELSPQPAAEPGLRAVIDCPAGRIELA